MQNVQEKFNLRTYIRLTVDPDNSFVDKQHE